MTEDGKERIYKVALAGLLHDIGKFGQRAGESGTGGRNDHSAVGDKFVSRYVPEKWRGAMAPVGWHHGYPDDGRLPDLLPVRIVALADRLSAGEREKQEKDSSRPKQLVSIFSRIKLTEDEPDHPPAYIPLRPLELSEDVVFPKENPDSPEETKSRYRELWTEFCTAAEALVAVDGEIDIASYLEGMLHLLRRYTWAIPSAYYYATPDVSLYEHLHTTAALSACFVREWGGESADVIDSLLDAIRGREPPDWPDHPQVAGLLSGDISGIQSFIYGIHHPKKATAVLRARSFYIQMLSEATARFILRELGLPITNALYIGGGTFTLIVPPLAEGKVAELSRRINEILFRAHHGDLYLALGQVPMAPRDFGYVPQRLQGPEERGLAKINDQLAGILDDEKAHRFSELSEDDLTELFSPKGHGSEQICSICGHEVGEEEELKVEQEEGGELRWCPSCDAFRQLGDRLRRANYLRISEVEARPGAGSGIRTWGEVFRAFGLDFAVGDEPPAPPPGAGRSALVALTDTGDPHSTANTAVGHRFLVNIVPEDGDKGIKSFDILARESQGAHYLGILRMDMDNLGRIFSRGLREYDSLSRRATLSLLVSVFFEGWVGRIAADTGAGRLYSVYSGGDDLFFAGSWDATVALARRIRRDLERFTNRPDLGISGGIALVHEKYPLYLAARDAEQVEKRAKHLRKEKDAFCFIQTPLSWGRFGYDGGEDTVSAWAEALIALVRGDTGKRAILRVVQDLYLHYEHERSTRGPMGPWVWHAAYWFTRAQQREKKNVELVQLYERLNALLAGEEFANNIEWLALAARWAELATRKEEKNAE